MKIKLAKLLSDVTASRRGATAIEYGLIAALIALVVAGGAASLGGAVDTKLGTVQSCVSATGASIATACP